MLYRHSFRKKKLDYIPFLLKKPLKSSYNILKVERKKKRKGRRERKERKLSPRLSMIWMLPVSLILSCIFLYFTQYNQGPLVSFLFFKSKVPSFCTLVSPALAFDMVESFPSCYLLSETMSDHTIWSLLHSQSLYILPFYFRNTTTIWKCLFLCLLIICLLLVNRNSLRARILFLSFISNFHLAECLAYSNHLINVYLINQQSSE